MKDKLIQFIAIIAFLYLANIGGGIIEFVPDNLPAVGNVDEVIATAVLMASMRYLNSEPME